MKDRLLGRRRVRRRHDRHSGDHRGAHDSKWGERPVRQWVGHGCDDQCRPKAKPDSDRVLTRDVGAGAETGITAVALPGVATRAAGEVRSICATGA
jgi:hypothetical protein